MPIPEPVKVSVSDARAQLADLLEQIAKGDGLRVVVERYGHPIAVLLHPEEVAVLDRIEERFVEIEVKRLGAEGRLGKGKDAISLDELLRRLSEERSRDDLAKAIERTAARSAPATTAPAGRPRKARRTSRAERPRR